MARTNAENTLEASRETSGKPAPQSPPDASEDFRGYARMGYLSVAAVTAGFCLWSAAAPLDSAALAAARVAVEGDRKPIQHLEGGIVHEIFAREAGRVKAGELLFRFDITKARANAESLRKQWLGLRAAEARLMAEMAAEAEVRFPLELAGAAAGSEAQAMLSDQLRLFTERSRTMRLQTAGLAARARQASEDITARRSRLEATRRQIRSLGEELAAVGTIAAKGYYPMNKLKAMQRDRDRLEGEAGGIAGDIARLEASIEETQQLMLQIEQRQREEAGRELTETRLKINEARERLAVAEDQMNRIEVRAPVDGIVLGLKVKGAGAVVAPGAVLAEIVPVDARLVMAARIRPADIQGIAAGQKAEIRFPAFANRSIGPIHGRVETVSADAVPEEHGLESTYHSRIIIDQTSIPVELADKLLPGMPADVLITKGERTLFGYLFGPLRDRLAKAMREA